MPALDFIKVAGRKPPSIQAVVVAVVFGAMGLLAACAEPPTSQPGGAAIGVRPEAVVIEAPPGTQRPPYTFSSEDSRLLDEVQRGAFRYLWEYASPKTGMVYDRSSAKIVSVAGVGFQLSAIPIGIERGWISAKEGRARAELILSSLAGNPANRHAGLFFHYVSENDAGPSVAGYESVVSTIDSAILLAGVATASVYFGGEVARLGDGLLDAADWSSFRGGDEGKAHERGFISLGWRPLDRTKPLGAGKLLPYYWIDSGDEHRLVTFLAVGATVEGHGVEPALYYRLRRALGRHGDGEPMVWFPWSGALFTAIFAHCWIDYAHLGPDNPAALGAERRARVDWWENSRRTVQMHRAKAIENPHGLPTLGVNAWGVSASDTRAGYAVPGLFPKPIPMIGALADVDFAPVQAADNYGDGTIAPYAPGAAILFEPKAAVAALRYARGLTTADGAPLVWRDPGQGGCGFLDSYCLTQPPWVAPDYVAIDQGPLLIAIENARTGLVWDLFSSHRVARTAVERLGLRKVPSSGRWPIQNQKSAVSP